MFIQINYSDSKHCYCDTSHAVVILTRQVILVLKCFVPAKELVSQWSNNMFVGVPVNTFVMWVVCWEVNNVCCKGREKHITCCIGWAIYLLDNVSIGEKGHITGVLRMCRI